MKPVTLYKPSSIQEAMQILAHHGTEAAVYAGGTDLLIRLKNRLNAAPKYLVDIKRIGEPVGRGPSLR
jgi:CO/xanthine dehydrogenase FAD-binding subunit